MKVITPYLDSHVEQVIQEAGLILKFPPPYSLDYSLIELSFSVLKAWMRRHFRRVWPRYHEEGHTFGDFIQLAIEHSRCDQYGREHYQHAGGGYIFEGDYEALQRELEMWSLDDPE